MRHRESGSINTAIADARAEVALQHTDAWRIIRPNGQLSLESWQHYREARECLCRIRAADVLNTLRIAFRAEDIPTGMRLRARVNAMIEAAGYRIRPGSSTREAAAARERLRPKPLTNRRSRRGVIRR